MAFENPQAWIAKIVGGLFATVVAPIVVAVGLKYSDAVLPPTDAHSAAALNAESPPPSAQPSLESASALPVSSVVRLFNGRDLSGFHTWLGPPHKGAKPLGLDRDPRKVFQVVDGLLRISGEIDGVLTTAHTYADYHLTVEYKWGEKTWPPREALSRTSGILLHCGNRQKPGQRGAGNAGSGRGGWPASIKCQIKEGATGDFVLVGGKQGGNASISVEADRHDIGKADQHRVLFSYHPGAPLTTLSTGFAMRSPRDQHWRDVKGFRGQDDLERPAGEWNTLECICRGDTITTRLNGRIVNVATAVRPRRGRIALQSAGAEIYFRRVNLQPLAADAGASQPLAKRQ